VPIRAQIQIVFFNPFLAAFCAFIGTKLSKKYHLEIQKESHLWLSAIQAIRFLGRERKLGLRKDSPKVDILLVQ
jgi:hypothetical protein